jgi:hypothetical protein
MSWLPPWLPRLAAGAAIALAVAVVLVLALRFTVGSGNDGGEPAPVSGHSHSIDHSIDHRIDHSQDHSHEVDPVSAGLLVADGITVLAVVVLLLRRPRRSAPDRR